jgi:hypothetical protein
MDAPAPVSASAVFASGDDAMFSIRLTASRSDRRCTPPFVHIATRVRPILPDTRPTSIRTLSFGRPLLSAVTRINTVPAHIQSIRSRASKVSNLRGNSSTMHLPTTPGRLVKYCATCNARARSADEDPTNIDSRGVSPAKMIQWVIFITTDFGEHETKRH